jgi:dihydrofolate reductase
MTKVTANMAISLDGYAAGPNQSRDAPMGEGVGDRLHGWMFEEPEAHPEELAAMTAAGAFVMGRNMFGPIRGPHDDAWTGWWGPEPPYHAPVYVLTHHARDPIPMEGGTTFHFVTDGIESALAQARAAAGEGDVLIAGGAATLRQYLAAGLLDELQLHIAPVVLGRGERLLDGVGDLALEPVAVRGTKMVTHVRYRIDR